MAPDEVVSPELARHLTEISGALRRQVGVLLTREGSVRHVIVGDAQTLDASEEGDYSERVVRLLPPLTFTDADAKSLIAALAPLIRKFLSA